MYETENNMNPVPEPELKPEPESETREQKKPGTFGKIMMTICMGLLFG